MSRVRQAELARKLGVKRQAINALVNRGILIVGDDGLIDEDEARAAIANSVHPAGRTASAIRADGEPASPPDRSSDRMPSYQAIKTMRELVGLRIDEIKLREEQGDLVSIRKVESILTASAIAAREQLRQQASALAFRMEGMDRENREALLKVAFDDLLSRIAHLHIDDDVDDESDDDTEGDDE